MSGGKDFFVLVRRLRNGITQLHVYTHITLALSHPEASLTACNNRVEL